MPQVAAGLIALEATELGVTVEVATDIDIAVISTLASLAISGISRLLGIGVNKSGFASPGTVRQPISPWQVIYGQARVGGILTFIDTTGSNHEKLQLVVTVAGHQVHAISSVYLDGWELILDGSGNCTGSYDPNGVLGTRFNGLVHCEFNLGTAGQSAFAGLVAADPQWTTSCKQSGRAGVYIQLTYDQTDFYSGVPTVTFMVQGALVYDPRSSTTTYSDNAALCINDYLTNTDYGLGADYATEIDQAQLIAAANICDQTVALKAGGTEPRYTINGSFTTDQSLQDTIQALASAMAGSVVWSGGMWGIYPAQWNGSSLSLTDNDFRAALKLQVRQSKRDIFNSVKGTFIDPLHQWQPNDFPYWSNSTYVTEDGGEFIWKDVQLPFTTSWTMAQRICKIELERARRQMVLTLPARLSAWAVRPPDVLDITYSRFGWTNQTFETTNVQLSFDTTTGAPAPVVDIVCQQTDSSVYSWSLEETNDLISTPTIQPPNMGSVPVVSGVGLSTGSSAAQTGSDGIVQPGIKVTWTIPTASFANVVLIFYRVHGTTPWISAGHATYSAGTFIISGGLVAGTSYDVELIARNVRMALATAVTAGPITVTSPTSVLGSTVQQYGSGGTGPYTPVGLGNNNQQIGTGQLHPVNTGNTPNIQPLTQYGVTTTISVGSTTFTYGLGSVTYNSGTVNPGSYGTWFIYCLDPTYAGGAVTYLATSNVQDLTSAEGVVYFGVIITTIGGGGTGDGGGSGACVAAGTPVWMADGELVPVEKLAPGSAVRTPDGSARIVSVEEIKDATLRRITAGNCMLACSDAHPIMAWGLWRLVGDIWWSEPRGVRAWTNEGMLSATREDAGTGSVYRIKLDVDHRYNAGGFWSHNTLKS